MSDKKPEETVDLVREYIEKINKNYEGSVIEIGGKFKALNLRRFSSGILSLDCALGGGWPFSRVAIVAGEYSTGKTLIALKACQHVENYDHKTKLHKDFCEGEFIPGRALFIDVEGAFDLDWSRTNGFNDEWHVVARPEYSEQAIDIVTDAIRENIFDLIIIDSIAALTPMKEIEDSVEDWQMGLAARLNNKAMRRWNASLNKMSHSGDGIGPLVLCLNQFRMKIGMSFGDPRTLPGGKGQEFCSSIIVFTKGQEYDDTKEKEAGKVKLRGVVKKNKTFVPKINYEFELSLKDEDGKPKGQINNIKALVDNGKKYKLILVDKKVKFGDKEFKTQKELKETLAVSPVLQRKLWRSIVKAATENIV